MAFSTTFGYPGYLSGPPSTNASIIGLNCSSMKDSALNLSSVNKVSKSLTWVYATNKKVNHSRDTMSSCHCMQYQEKLMIQTREIYQKSSFRSIIRPILSRVWPGNFFSKIIFCHFSPLTTL